MRILYVDLDVCMCRYASCAFEKIMSTYLIVCSYVIGVYHHFQHYTVTISFIVCGNWNIRWKSPTCWKLL